MIFVILESASCLNMRNRFISISRSNEEFTCAATQIAYCISSKQLFDHLLLTAGSFIHIIAETTLAVQSKQPLLAGPGT